MRARPSSTARLRSASKYCDCGLLASGGTPRCRKLAGSPQALTCRKNDHMPKSLGPSNDAIPADEFRTAEAIARTELANAAFRALDPARKRVAIAKDVLRWLANGKLKPGYAYLDIPEFYDNPRDIVNGGTCEACAVGSLFACAVERGDAGGTVRRSPTSSHLLGEDAIEIHRKLAGLFEPEQLALIEAAFETEDRLPVTTIQAVLGSEIYRDHPKAQEYFRKAWDFCPSQERDERMRLIMGNIIANKGAFVP